MKIIIIMMNKFINYSSLKSFIFDKFTMNFNLKFEY